MAVLATDDFNRANSTGLGANWTTLTGGSVVDGFDVVSNTAQPHIITNDEATRYTAIAWPNDHYSQAALSMSGIGAGTGPGVVVRATNGGNWYRCVVNHAGSNNLVMHQTVGGVSTTLATLTVTWTDGDILRLLAVGTTLRIFQNGAQVGADVIDAALASGSPGLFYSTTSTTAVVDSWEGGTPAASSDDPPIGFSGRGAGW
jgi:hypothetical protein